MSRQPRAREEEKATFREHRKTSDAMRLEQVIKAGENNRKFWTIVESTIEVQHLEVRKGGAQDAAAVAAGAGVSAVGPNASSTTRTARATSSLGGGGGGAGGTGGGVPKAFHHVAAAEAEAQAAETAKRWRSLVNPDGYKKLAFDAVSGLAIVYSVIEVPFLIAFLSAYNVPALNIIDLCVAGIFFVDICISFNLPFSDAKTGKWVLDRGLIARRYLRMWFWIDCAAAIPFDTITLVFNVGGAHVAAVRLIRILRLFRLAKVFKLSKKAQQQLKDTLEDANVDTNVISGFILLLQILFIAHLIGCFWFFLTTPVAANTGRTVTTAEGQTDDAGYHVAAGTGIRTWASNFGYYNPEDGVFTAVDQSPISTQYIASLYWTFFTILTVGYGDIHATNTGERFYALMTMLVGSLLFGAIIAKVRVHQWTRRRSFP